MLYLGIDQHSKQITVCVRNHDGDSVLRRQVSTRPEKITAFFEQIVQMDSEFMAILECCGFNDWLIEELRKYDCREVVLIHPDKPSKKKTDRRDARKLCDLLWLNRERLAAGQNVHGLRRVYIVTQQEQEDRQLTALRKHLGQRRTRTTNKIHRILHRHNLSCDLAAPSSSIFLCILVRLFMACPTVADSPQQSAGHIRRVPSATNRDQRVLG